MLVIRSEKYMEAVIENCRKEMHRGEGRDKHDNEEIEHKQE